MILETNIWNIDDVVLHEKTMYQKGLLNIDMLEFKKVATNIHGVDDVKIHLAKPGEKVRITSVLDVTEPRITKEGQDIFPGFLSPPVAFQSCSIHRLQGVAVVTAAKVEGIEPASAPKQGIIDMYGSGAEYTPFSKTHNVVVEVMLNRDLSSDEADNAIRLTGLKASSYLARTTIGKQGGESYSYQLKETSRNLPKIVAIVQLAGNGGPFSDCYVYGRSTIGMFPTYMHPNEFFYGAVVGSNYTYGCQRNFTYMYLNNSLIDHLYRVHGRECTFLGTIIARGTKPSLEDKLMSANYAAKIAKRLGADGAILTADGAGNNHIDVMLTSEQCEKMGIRTVIQINEIAGPEGTDPSLVDFVSEADAIVSVGNREEHIDIEEMYTIGQTLEATEGTIKVAVRDICGATNEMGQWNIGALDY
jgi:glycine reductase